MIDAIGIIVPAHDEEELLPACLEALERARIEIPTRIVVVLDSCADDSAEVAGEYGIEVSHRCVGRARAAGVDAIRRHFPDVPPSRLWLANTDADSRVSATWLERQIEFARSFVAVAGTVAVDEWEELSSEHIAMYESFYSEKNDHIHGANLGIRADAYLAAGGFPPVATGEDVALWNTLRALGLPITTTRANAVTTSSRLVARAPDRIAAFLRAWAA